MRKQFLALRGAIPAHRRATAAKALVALRLRGRVLSFYSIGSEIDLSLLNKALLEKGHLICNRVEQGILVPYHIGPETGLTVSNLGIPEPDPTTCRRADMTEIDLILVPGLAFDHDRYRLGYGKGFYDGLLSTTGNIPTMGIGFKEQLSTEILPRDAWDVPVKELLLI